MNSQDCKEKYFKKTDKVRREIGEGLSKLSQKFKRIQPSSSKNNNQETIDYTDEEEIEGFVIIEKKPSTTQDEMPPTYEDLKLNCSSINSTSSDDVQPSQTSSCFPKDMKNSRHRSSAPDSSIS